MECQLYQIESSGEVKLRVFKICGSLFKMSGSLEVLNEAIPKFQNA